MTRLAATVLVALLAVVPVCSEASEQATHEAPSELGRPPSPRPTHADEFFGVRGDLSNPDARDLRSVGEETLWIFDADFEDLTGDNAGWTSLDMSGTLEVANYWHKDTIHINGFEWLGDSTWWCGTYNDCWRQPRGYGNDWICILERSFPEVVANTEPGDEVFFKWDQRYALELDYDYGYVDMSDDGGNTWTTLQTWSNYGFAGTPGRSIDWDTSCSCHQPHRTQDMSAYAGLEVAIRFRCETDVAYSSQDQYNNPPQNSCYDGAWQLDNFEWTVNGTTFWFDDCESPGDNGWVHDNLSASGQTGVVFERVFAPDILRDQWWCWWRPEGWWMAALDAETGRMVDGQDSWLISPPIDISGADGLVGRWDAWVDLGGGSPPMYDFYKLYLSTGYEPDCVLEFPNFIEADPYSWPYGGPAVMQEDEDWDGWAWGDWLAIGWRIGQYEPIQPGVEHWPGLMLDRQRVGVPVGGPPTRWDYGAWDRFHDTFDPTEALTDTAWIRITDSDGIIAARAVFSSDAGETWESSTMIRNGPESTYWKAAPPSGHIAPSTEIWYYFESTDGAGNVRTHPKNAPDSYYEFSILPILGTIAEPTVLLVDKHGRVIRNEDGEFRQTSERYFREALDILGFEYDVYDVEVPSGSTDQSNGPDSAGYKYYDTQIWFTNDFDYYTIKAFDQINLINWLSQSEEGRERNLLLTGNGIGHELMENGGDTLSFYSTWLASEFIRDDVASTSDTLLTLRDASGGSDFMTYDDKSCPLRLLEWDYG